MLQKNFLTLARIAAILIMALALAVPAHAEEKARLTNIVVTNTRDDLLLYLSMEGCFTSHMQQAIMNGVPTTFSIFISLYKIRDLWWDKELADITVKHTIKYDVLKKEFLVTRSEAADRPIVTHSFEDAKKAMTEVDSLKIIPLSSLEKRHPYQIKVKAELDPVKWPLSLHRVLIFPMLWDFETDWYTIDFYY